ncbi:gamma-glutamylcyclotransferase family protein [Larkinella sp. GY13]|uniref:gamma-glutamylcyclotransferase family protein n=1 Tax=Larkinella sp. GY13 TaxID=3453720 RepID=UPI003EEBD9F5
MSTSTTSFIHLFVYGTLLSASKHPMAQDLRQKAQLLGPAFFPGRLYDLGTYPGAVYDPIAQTNVYGEVYSFTESVWKREQETLDDYEGNEYVRAIVPVQTDDGLVDCWMYLFKPPTDSLPLIASGRYFGQKGNQK